MGKNGKKIDVIVLNSHGVGQICHVKRLPRRGETMEATHWRVEEDGGKGATVSVALGRLGVSTGYIGKVKNYFSQNKKVGVELFQQTNDASSKGLFWFSESKVVAAGSLPDAMMEYIKADLNATFGVANHIRRSRQTGLPQIKKVIYSGPKTIILWADNTKTIVSCGEADSYDYYSGFCAAVVKKLFGSTTHAKKVLGDSIQIND